MINCNNMTRTETTNLIFMPVGIMSYLGDFLKEANIPFEIHNWRTFLQTRDPYDVKAEYKDIIEDTRIRYKNAGYSDTTCIMAIEANLEPQEVFEKALLTFGKYMDSDLKRSIDEYAKQSDENEKYYVDDKYFE